MQRAPARLVSSAAHSSGSAAFLAPEIAHLAVQRAAAANQQFVHACLFFLVRVLLLLLAHSAGVKVFIDSACISSRILSPSVA